jgi:mercuric ion binding protein
MKNLGLPVLVSFLLMAVALPQGFAQSLTDTVKVWGNCGMCRQHIEKAAKKAGADKANWNMDTKILVVSYNAQKTSNDEIQKKIAAAGYDTEKYMADEKAYKKLDECCQYDRKKTK